MAQLTFNSKHSDTTKMTSFYANYDRESNLLNYEQSEVSADAAERQVKTLRMVHNNIVRMQQRFFKYINKKRKMAPLLKKRDKVYLLTKNLKTKKASKKLDNVKIESFYVKEVRELKTYELKLSKNIRIFLIFDIFLLESADPKTLIQKTFHFEEEEKEIYTVERILKRRDQNYLIKWKEYSHSENT